MYFIFWNAFCKYPSTSTQVQSQQTALLMQTNGDRTLGPASKGQGLGKEVSALALGLGGLALKAGAETGSEAEAETLRREFHPSQGHCQGTD